VVTNSPLAIESEPRVKKLTETGAGGAPEMKASHPFFWAGCMLVDGGSPPEKEKK
jgi:hypothetical protein